MHKVFPYREEEPRGDGTFHVRPTLDLAVSNGQQEIVVRALVDTGAPRCVFGRAVADALFIDLDVFDSRPLSLLGHKVRATTASVTLSFRPFFSRTWEVEAAFLHADLDLSYIGVLGTEGFFDRWVASFNFYDGYFVVEDHQDWASRIEFDASPFQLNRYDEDWTRPRSD